MTGLHGEGERSDPGRIVGSCHSCTRTVGMIEIGIRPVPAALLADIETNERAEPHRVDAEKHARSRASVGDLGRLTLRRPTDSSAERNKLLTVWSYGVPWASTVLT